jgi:hypothetical protein
MATLQFNALEPHSAKPECLGKGAREKDDEDEYPQSKRAG